MSYTVDNYLNTSVDDCKSSLQHCTDMDLLKELLVECIKRGHTTREKYVRSRITQLERTPK